MSDEIHGTSMSWKFQLSLQDYTVLINSNILHTSQDLQSRNITKAKAVTAKAGQCSTLARVKGGKYSSGKRFLDLAANFLIVL